MKVIAKNLVTHLNMLVFRNSIAYFTCVTRVQDDLYAPMKSLYLIIYEESVNKGKLS